MRAGSPHHDRRPVWPVELLAEVRLSMVKDVGPRSYAKLVATLGSAAAVLAASEAALQRVDGIGPKLSRRISEAPTEEEVCTELAVAAKYGIAVLRRGEEDYPAPLREIVDPPAILYYRGTLDLQDRLAVAIVGTRRATHYGLRQAEQLAAGLAHAGVTVVSGLARGIDAAAHRGALDAGGRTIAVIAGGLLEVTPPENLPLADRVATQGYLLSEAAPRRPPLAGSFPQRNRLISGLSLGVLVIEADQRSGSLITARHASEQGRDVFALPGPITSRVSRGCHRLIQDGAKLVTQVEDVLDELTYPVKSVPRPEGGEIRHAGELKLNPVERQVLDAIQTLPTELDEVVTATQLPIHQVLSTVSVLEMRRLIRRLSGTQVSRL